MRADVTAELELGALRPASGRRGIPVAPVLSLLVRPSYDTDEPAVKRECPRDP